METAVNKLCTVSKPSYQLLETTSLMRFWGASLCFGLTETTCSNSLEVGGKHPDGLKPCDGSE